MSISNISPSTILYNTIQIIYSIICIDYLYKVITFKKIMNVFIGSKGIDAIHIDIIYINIVAKKIFQECINVVTFSSDFGEILLLILGFLQNG